MNKITTPNLFCYNCSLQFDKKYVFDLHLSLVHGKKVEVKSEPKICEENFQESQANGQDFSAEHLITKKALKRHIDTAHQRKKPFQCKVCDAIFTANHRLKSHIDSIHENKKPYKCNICDTSFAYKHQLNTHV